MIKKCKKCQSTNFRIAIANNTAWINCSHCNDEEEFNPYDDIFKLTEDKK